MLWHKAQGAGGTGEAEPFIVDVTSNLNLNGQSLYTYLVGLGWDNSAPVTMTISSGVYVANSRFGWGLETGTLGGSVTIVNNGYIVGLGGTGGNSVDAPGGPLDGTEGQVGIVVSSPITIDNTNGVIAGGGGGGGGGGASDLGSPIGPLLGNGGGGGGGGSEPIVGSAGGFGANYALNGFGSSGQFGGIGGSSTFQEYNDGQYFYAADGGTGGDGGEWGQNGNSGNSGFAFTNDDSGPPLFEPTYPPVNSYSGTSGGGGANAISGNFNITWINTGTRYGAIS